MRLGERRQKTGLVTEGRLQTVTDLFSSFCWGADTDWAQMWAGSHLKVTPSTAQSWNNLKKYKRVTLEGFKKGKILPLYRFLYSLSQWWGQLKSPICNCKQSVSWFHQNPLKCCWKWVLLQQPGPPLPLPKYILHSSNSEDNEAGECSDCWF